MNSLTKLIADMKERATEQTDSMFENSVPESWFDGRRDGYRIAAQMVEMEFSLLLEKIRAAESKIIESEVES